jgi:hypothetical protein
VPKRTHPPHCLFGVAAESGFEIGQNRMSGLCYLNFYGTFGLSLSDNRHERAGMVADDPSGNEGEVYESVTCLACTRFHLISRSTGKVLGDDE